MGSLHMSPIYRVSIVALLHSQYASEHREESQLNNDSAHAKKEIFRNVNVHLRARKLFPWPLGPKTYGDLIHLMGDRYKRTTKQEHERGYRKSPRMLVQHSKELFEDSVLSDDVITNAT